MTEWRRSPAVAVTALVLFLVIQLSLPISRLGSGTPERLGWQMFSKALDPLEFVIHTDDGSETVILDEVLARVRLDMPLELLVPPTVCESTPDAVRVTWNDETYEC